MTGIYTLNENIFEDEFLSSCVTDRPQSQVTEPACAFLVSNYTNEDGISAGLLKVSAELIRTFPKMEQENWRKKT